MFDDRDMKIVEGSPSKSVKYNLSHSEEVLSVEEISSAKKLGEKIADKFLESVDTVFADDNTDSIMMLQRQLLLSFTVSITLDDYCKNDSIAGIAEKSFLDKLKVLSPQIYDTCSDTGAFSFYYLAVRRKTEVERRIGQTFAMLCSHDSDPIYQELGETLYCWFMSVVKDEINSFSLLK